MRTSRVVPVRAFQQGRTIGGGTVRSSLLRKLWEISALGFCLQDLAHQFGCFLEELPRPYHCLQIGKVLEERGRFGDSVFLRSRRLYLIYGLETSLRCL
jgi:hypothetical protein